MNKNEEKVGEEKEQAMRFNGGKPQLSYILDFPNAMQAFVDVCMQGAEKYERHNWKKGMPVSEIMDSLLRHAMRFNLGEDYDKESGKLHVAHMMWNCAALIETLARHRAEFDDRDCYWNPEEGVDNNG